MNNKFLLTLAAKAAQINVHEYENDYLWIKRLSETNETQECLEIWQPLLSNADAFSLMVKLKIELDFENLGDVMAYYHNGDFKDYCFEEVSTTLEAATRLAIVRAAAEIGSYNR